MGMISEALSGGETENAHQNNYWAVQSILNGVNKPSVESMKVKLQDMVQQGTLTPEQAQTYLQSASEYNSIDPRAQEAQQGALGQLQEVVDTRGMDPQSLAALRQLQEQTQGAERGSREAILQNAAARGISGSGVELASQMGNQQASATQLANQGFQTAADNNARRLAAIQGVGSLGGQITSQDQNKAAAQNAINQFNTANQQSTGMYNTQTANAAQAQNLSEKQRIADTNVGTANQQELYNKGLLQQDFGNQLAKGQALANANLGAAQGEVGIAEHKTKASDKWSDVNLKTDIKEIDPQEFMDALTGYKYKYKSDKHGKGDQVGILAQDLEKVLPQAIVEKEDGKAIDYSKVGGPALAALASLNDRVSSLEGGE